METSNPRPNPYGDAVARSLAPSLAAIRAQSNYPGRHLAAVIAQQNLVQSDLGKRIAAQAMRSQMPSTVHIQSLLRQLQVTTGTSLARAIAEMNRQQPAFTALARVIEAQSASVRRSVAPLGLQQEWLDRIATSLYASTLSGRLRNQMAEFLDEVYDTLDEQDEAPEALAGDIGDLDELAAQGMAFVAAEGQGLSWEAQRRLLAWFVGLAVFGVLMQAIVMSDAVKDLFEDAAVPASIAAMAMMATRQEWDRKNPRPDGQDTDEGEAGRDRE
ncbi:hypothetical protein ACWD04_32960 [Streptomyces sp. NPDC002911]